MLYKQAQEKNLTPLGVILPTSRWGDFDQQFGVISITEPYDNAMLLHHVISSDSGVFEYRKQYVSHSIVCHMNQSMIGSKEKKNEAKQRKR